MKYKGDSLKITNINGTSSNLENKFFFSFFSNFFQMEMVSNGTSKGCVLTYVAFPVLFILIKTDLKS